VAPKRLVHAALLVLAVGLAGCRHGKEEAGSEGVDLAAIRARRDSLRQAAIRDSVVRAHYKACSDSVMDVLAKAAKKSAKGKKKKAAAAEPGAPGMIPPEVLSACGKVPAPRPLPVAQAAETTHGKSTPAESTARAMKGKADSAAHLISMATDSAAGAIKAKAVPAETTAKAKVPAKDTTKLVKAPAKDTTKATKAPAKDTTKVAKAPTPAPAPKLSAKQLAVLRADSIRQARERAKQDSLKQVAERARIDSVARVQRDSIRAESLKVARETEVLRETFTYSGGSRDPFVSLITEDKVGPEFNDLLLVGVYLDLRHPSNSVAVLRDKTNMKRYKLRVGDRLGRLKVAQIRQSDVVFTVEDIGFERQETLSLRKKEDQTP